MDRPPIHNILAFCCGFPANHVVHYALFRPIDGSLDALEFARRSLLKPSPTILDTPLPSLRLDADPFMFVFSVADPSASPLRTLSFDGLAVVEASSFSPPNPATTCPDAAKRKLCSHFFDALRSRFIDGIVTASMASRTPRQVKRFKSGFLVNHTSYSSDWEYKPIQRPLIFCHLHIGFAYDSNGSVTGLIIHPMLQSTPLLDLFRSLPLPPGAPILLLPYGTPAYYLSSYSGPTTSLVKLFRASLDGLGAGDWDDDKPSSSMSATFIIGWIKVENKQGEDKGTTFIWPTRLCLSYMPHSVSRAQLDYIPVLPAPLQPSPQVPPALPSVSALSQSFDLESTRSLTDTLHDLHRPSIFSSPTAESLSSFKTLSVSKTKDLREVAVEVGGYIDAVARERERERERLKREREGASLSPKMARSVPPSTPLAPAATIGVAQSQPGPSVASTSQVPHHSAPPAPPPMSAQTFYPSPPQISTAVSSFNDVNTSPVVETPSFPLEDTMVVEPPQTEQAADTGTAPSLPANRYDPFDNGWGQSSDNYLGMDMGFNMDDMGMNFGMNSVNNAGASGMAYTETRNDMDFDTAFTDDDFSFFDQPSKPSSGLPFDPDARIPLPISHLGLLDDPALSPSLFEALHLQNGALSHNQQLFTPGAAVDTPRTLDHPDTIPPELLPSSPGQTPDSHSGPVTPSVYLDFDLSSKPVSGIFDPIPFASYHREADGKYAIGKFALQLPSPPAEDDSSLETVVRPLPTTPISGPPLVGWRQRYDAVTDPRIGVVRKLIGVKRKTPVQGMRDPPRKAPWAHADEEWEQPSMDQGDDDEVKSEVDSDEEDDLDDIETPLISRPTTPPPPYLPLGPTLLHTQFQHAQLLPLSVPLRPPGSSSTAMNISGPNPPPSVPTPVSPSATIGQASERSKSLEAAAVVIAREVVENPLWAHTWRSLSITAKSMSAVWSTDIKAVAQLMEQAPLVGPKLDLCTLFGLPEETPVQQMEVPLFTAGKGDVMLQVLPSALRFWEKVGLGPKSGKKDVSVFVLFEGDEEVRASQVDSWLDAMANVYQNKNYGHFTRGKSPACARDGLLPIRMDSTFRKTLTTFTSGLSSPEKAVTVIFLMLPSAVMTLSSPVLRQIVSVSRKLLSNVEVQNLLFEFIPEQFIVAPPKPSSYDSALEVFALSVYNRILSPITRGGSTLLRVTDEPSVDMLMAPAFTLSRPIHNKVSYVRATEASLDVVDRFTLFHIAYHVSACGKWILAACVDQRGESYELGVWLTQPAGANDSDGELSEEEYIVRKVWEFGMGLARRANIEWRIVVSRLGVMSQREYDAWDIHLTVYVEASRQLPPLHVSLVCVDPESTWSFLAPSTASTTRSPHKIPGAKAQSVYSDISSTTYALYPTIRMPISHPISQADLGISQSYIPEPPCLNGSSEPPSPKPASRYDPHRAYNIPPDAPLEYEPHPITFLPIYTSLLVTVPQSQSTTSITTTSIHLLRTSHSESYTASTQAYQHSSATVPSDEELRNDITHNFYELSVLCKARWKLDFGLGSHPSRAALPFHLAAVDAMRVALDRDWDRLDAVGDI